MRAFSIGPVKFEIPDWLEGHDDDDGTLVAYPPQSDYANLRVSVSTIATEDNKPSLGAGQRIIRTIAAKEQRELHSEDDKVWFTEARPASDGSPGSTITFWHVGVGAHMATISCFIDSQEGDQATKERVRQAVTPLIRSLRADYTSV